MKALFRRGISVLCATALAVSMVPTAALADDLDESYGGNAADEGFVISASEEAAESGADAGPAVLDTNPDAPLYTDSDQAFITLREVSLQTSAQQQEAIQLFSADNGIQLAPGNHVRWIDRVVLPSYALTFYNMLEEAADNDGVKDYLIDDQYFNGTASNDGTYLSIGYDRALLVGSITSSATEEQISDVATAVMAAFDRDHPEVFWMSGDLVVGKVGSKVYMLLKDVYRDIRATGYQSAHAIKSGIETRDVAAKAILEGVEAGANQEAVVRYFNDWLTHNNEYNTNYYLSSTYNPDPWRCISALTGRVGTEGPVCEGYARAFKVLCDYAGIPCVLVDGNAVDPGSGNSEPHMWNYVELAGAWYAVDVTWDDPGAFTSGAVSGEENEDWLLVGGKTVIEDAEFLVTHPVENLVYENDIMYINGPVLSDEAFQPGTVTPVAVITLPVIVPVPPEEEEQKEPEPAPTVVLPTIPKIVSSVTLSAYTFTYNGKVQKPTVTVKSGNTKLSSSSYKVTFSGSCNKIGTYTVTVKGVGGYTGTVRATFKIVKPTVKKPTLKSVKSAKKKQLTISWKKVSGKVTGYQVQYALNKTFTKGAKKVKLTLTSKLKQKSKLTKTVKKLKSKKTYYVRVRTYYKVGGKTFCSAWSKVKKVRVK